MLNSLQVAPTSHHWTARNGREGAGKSGECVADRRATDIREVADEPELRRTARRTLSGYREAPNSAAGDE